MAKKRKAGKGGNGTVARKSKQPQVAAEQSKRRSLQLLVGCIVVLVVGLSIRYFWSSRQLETIRTMRASVIAAQRDGDWAKVEQIARSWAMLTPDEYEPWEYASRAAAELGDVSLEVGYLEAIPDDAPLEAFHRLGWLQMEELKSPQDSLETCLRTIAQYPSDVETHERLLYYYTMTCQRDLLRQEIHRAIDKGADSTVTYIYLFSSSWLTFIDGYSQNRLWLENEPGTDFYEIASVIHLYTRQVGDDGQQKQTLEDIQKYENELLAARKKFPSSVELLAAELEMRCEAGDLEDVQRLLADLPDSTRDDHRFLRFRGWLASANGQWENAKKHYETGLQLQSLEWQIQTELELVYRRLNMPDEAAQIRARAEHGKRVSRAVQLSPNLFNVSRETIEDLADYFEVCGMPKEAERLRFLAANI